MIFKLFATVFILSFAFNGLIAKELNVVCSTSDLAWLAKKIGKEKVKVIALSDGNDNPHYLDATPKFVRLVSQADVLCFVGLDLEIGWLPKVIQKSGNKKVKSGQIGSCDCSSNVEVLEKVHGPVDRSMGDAHPGGNPHYQLDPHRMLKAGKTILDTLIINSPEDEEFYNKNFAILASEMERLDSNLKEKIKDLGDIKVTQYHKEFSYLIDYLGLPSFEAIEKIPGVSPSAERLFSFGQECKENKITLCLACVHSPSGKLKKFKSISQVPYLQEKVSLVDYLDEGAYEKMMIGLVDKIALTQRVKN